MGKEGSVGAIFSSYAVLRALCVQASQRGIAVGLRFPSWLCRKGEDLLSISLRQGRAKSKLYIPAIPVVGQAGTLSSIGASWTDAAKIQTET